MEKETWGSKLMLILAVAGGAIGLGNFLRFPTLFAQYGGWFLVPYFISFFILGIPLMYVEWTLGIMGRDENKHSLFTLLDKFFYKKKSYRFLSILAILCVLVIGGYYVYMESWMLGYSALSLGGAFKTVKPDDLDNYLSNYLNFNLGTSATVISVISIVVCVFLNMYMSAKDVTSGIGKFINWCMPLLAVMCVVMLIKVFCTDNIVSGLKYMMRGEPSCLLDPKIWVAAASQMFFSLSVGFTASLVYVTYSNDDVNIRKDGFCCANINMLTEVFLASFLSIPIGFLAFGAETTEIAKSSTYCFGMVAMPSMFQGLFMAPVWCFLWFFLLFIAALLSSLSIFQVFVSYLSDLFNMSKVKSVVINMIP